MASKQVLSIIIAIGLIWAMYPLEAMGAPSATATLTQAPIGATLSRPFYQQVRIAVDTEPDSGWIFTINLPDDMELADLDADASYVDVVAIDSKSAGSGYAFNYDVIDSLCSSSVIKFTLSDTTGTWADPETLFVSFPITTSSDPSEATVRYGAIQCDSSLTSSPAVWSINTGLLPQITYVDAQDLSIVSSLFSSSFAGSDDTTNAQGDYYPSAAGIPITNLPDMLYDENSLDDTLDVPVVSGGFIPDSTNTNDITYSFWFSDANDLGIVNVNTARKATCADTVFTSCEGNAASMRFDVWELPAGTWYLYVTSNATDDYPLGHSDPLVVRHHPYVSMAKWDYNNNGIPDNGDTLSITLDTGGLYDRSNSAVTSGTNVFDESVDLHFTVVDYDDTSGVYVFYSISSTLDSAIVDNGVVTGLTDKATGTLSASKFYGANLTEDDIEFTLNVLTGSPSGSYIPANAYYVYVVGYDGVNSDVHVVGYGSDPLVFRVKHTPSIILDSIDEYDTDGASGNPITINTNADRYLAISWGKTGVNGDKDLDDNATIALYVDEDTDDDTYPDFGNGDGDDFADSVIAGGTLNPQLIVSGLYEDPDALSSNYHCWDIWSSNLTLTPDSTYHVYALIDDGTDKRVEVVGDNDGYFAGGSNSGEYIRFQHTPVAWLANPIAEGEAINARDQYRFNFTAFDFDDTDSLVIVAIKQESNSLGATTTLSAIMAQGDSMAWVLNSTDGTLANRTDVLEGTNTYFDFVAKPPDSSQTYLTKDIVDSTISISDGTYDIYIAALGTSDSTAWRAPGALKIIGLADDPPQQYLSIQPATFTAGKGDTIDLSLYGADNANDVELIDVYIAVDTTYFDVVTTSGEPFTNITSKGTDVYNHVLSSVNAGYLHLTLYNNANDIDLTNTGLGDLLAEFQLACKGTSAALMQTSDILFLRDSNYKTKFVKDGVQVSSTFRTPAASANIAPRPLVDGIANLSGRTSSNVNVTVELREWGSYDGVDDSYFAANDVDANTPGIQIALDANGKFDVPLVDVPPGQYDLVIHYDRYLDVSVRVSPTLGLDTTFVNFGTLMGGDCAGYTDSSGTSKGDNEINTTDFNKVYNNFGATSSSTSWDDTTNAQLADINEDGTVDIDDLVLALTYDGESGAPPTYKPVTGTDNRQAYLELTGIPDEVKAGRTYDVRVTAKDVGDLRGYLVMLRYDTQILRASDVQCGDFLGKQVYFMPMYDGDTVGIVNGILGTGAAVAGEGWLGTIRFEALKDAEMSDQRLALDTGKLVDSHFKKSLVGTLSKSGLLTPGEFALLPSYPNPFNPTTTIRFALPEHSHVTVSIYNGLGQLVRALASREFEAGHWSIQWNGQDENGRMVSSGVYFCQVVTDQHRAIDRMLFMK